MELDYDGLLEAYNLRIEECMYKGKRIEELEEENKKLKKECEENDYLVEDNARWIRECGEKTMEIKKLKEESKKFNKLKIRVYKNLPGDMWKEYQKFCEKNHI